MVSSVWRQPGQLAAGTCEVVTLDRDSSQPRRTIARQTARCACRKGQIAGTTRARPACVDVHEENKLPSQSSTCPHPDREVQKVKAQIETAQNRMAFHHQMSPPPPPLFLFRPSGEGDNSRRDWFCSTGSFQALLHFLQDYYN
ncbi:hypothetical protein FQN60_014331 [Etheostoma spectabile]|uniref:TAFA chemokine like family member 5 n=1 Tax=Etheostoma spectabile TaxID=54343 RepID=A0A5J5D8I3_9PERO|nr:hypothetical protein FQN60_014331 [Etheostoma spectabile]